MPAIVEIRPLKDKPYFTNPLLISGLLVTGHQFRGRITLFVGIASFRLSEIGGRKESSSL